MVASAPSAEAKAMAGLVIIARVAVAGMFGVAAVAKITDGGGRRAVTAFGVPGRVAGMLGWALISAELCAVVLLAVGSSSHVQQHGHRGVAPPTTRCRCRSVSFPT